MQIHDGWNMDRAEARRNPAPSWAPRPRGDWALRGAPVLVNAKVLGLLLVSAGPSMLCRQG